MIYVLAYPIFEPKSAERIRAFRAKHEPERARLVRPHITLVFGVADEHRQAVSGLVDMVSGQTSAFPIIFDRCVIEFDPFETKYKLFLLCPDENKGITALHDQLYDGVYRSELNSEHPFRPHMTIASCDERVDAEQIDVSEIGDLPIRANLCALTLVRLDGDRLTELKTAPLSAKV
ncbi:MAG: 2'-5' RNA ligase family protein [Pseudomonadota bacterium]